MTKLNPLKLLLIEDNPADVDITKEGLEESKIILELDVVTDGVEALNYLQKKGKYNEVETPDIILLDLNMPKMDGRELLNIIKNDDNLKSIPVIILTTSEAQKDIEISYNLHANAYLTKPVDFDEFTKMIKSFESFWLTFVKLPKSDS